MSRKATPAGPNQDGSQTQAVAVAVAVAVAIAVAVAVPTNERYLPTGYVGFTAMTQ
ncbi:hypothetical protein ACLB90_07915 [Stenotrophomonas sp. LGBM10]|uniref:hypothetical protein n=1 Tax=Stenotrophomonas sp. LGBM10 TaxID=3390038 RepID=UPI00398A9DBD